MTSEVKTLLGIGVATLVLIAGAVFLLGKSPSQPASPKVDQNVLGALVKDDSYKIASDSAKVTIVEFADFQCPACGVAHPTVKKVLEDYKGRINFYYRHFPLAQHKNAIPASLASEAAGNQGKFWEMYDKIYESQGDWSENSEAQQIFAGYAQDLELNMEKYNNDIGDSKLKDKINRDYQDGITLGVGSTPTFFINGQKFPGALSYTEFQTRIEAELNKQ